MAISTTTTSALASISGTPGDLYFNTDNNKFIIFHGTGTGSGNYKEFSDDGTLGASIGLSFNDNGMGDEQLYDQSYTYFFNVSANDLSGYYKRFDVHSDAITFIEAETQMSATSGISGAEIPGNSVQGMQSEPYLYQADGANAPMASGGNGQVFVFTGSIQGGSGAVSIATTYDDGMGTTGTWYYVPVIYLINGGLNNTAPLWGMTLVVAEGSSINFPYNTDPSSSNQEWGILNWGSGTVTVGNNEATVRQALSGASVVSSSGGNAGSWSLDSTYAP